MKKILSTLIFLTLLIPNVYAVTKVPAKDVTVDTSSFGDAIPIDANTVQKALQAVNDNGTGGGGSPAGTQGQYQYNNNGNFAAGSMLYTNGTNIGVGSSAPGAKLDITGTVRATGIQLSTNPSSGYVLTSNSVGVGTWAPIPSSGGGTPGGSSGQLQYNSSSSFAGVTGSGVDSNGNIGIGSTAPGAALDVVGNTRLNGTWNIGVGTLSPSQVLAVNGNLSINGGISTIDWTDPINDWHAAGIITSTTGTISSGSNNLVVADATGWSVGMGIAVTNAGSGGNTELISYVTSIVGTTLVLANNAAATATTQAVNHDDTRAIQFAVNSGKNVHLRAGNYNVTSQITIANALLINGDGNRGRNIANGETLTTMGTAIINRGTTNNIFSIQIGDTKMSNFAILQNTTITPTAGYAFVYGPATKILNVGLSYITVYGTAGGIRINSFISVGWFNNLVIWTIGSSTLAALYVDNDTPAGDLNWTDCDFRGTVTTVGKGIWIRSADTQTFNNVKVNSSDPDLTIDDGGGAVINQRFNGCSFEAGSNTGALINISSTNALGVKNINFIGGEIGVGNNQDGVLISSQAGQITFVGVLFHQLADGVQVDSTSGPVSVVGSIFNSMSGIPVRWTVGSNNVNVVGNPFSTGNANLEVYSNTSSQPILRGIQAVASGSSSGASMQLVNDDGAAIANGDRISSIFFGGSEDNAHTLGFGAAISSFSEGLWTTSSSPASVSFLTAPSGSTTRSERMRVSSSGNVGIASTNPGAILDVVGAIRASSDVKIGANSLCQSDGTNCPAGGSSQLLTGTVGIGTYGNFGIGTINPQARLIVLDGNVGLGTITASTRLDTDGFRLSTNPSAGYILTSNTVGVGTWMPASGGGGSPGGSGTEIQYRSGASSFGAVTGSSFNGTNVGIASSAPGATLDVQGTIRASSDIKVGSQSLCQANGTNCPAGGTNPWLITVGAGNVGVSTTGPTGTVGIGTTFGSGTLVVMGGPVGIGTWNPANGLDVRSNLSVGFPATAIAPALGAIINGNVGIGTSVPGIQLAVGTGATITTLNSTGSISQNSAATTTNGTVMTSNSLSSGTGLTVTTNSTSLTGVVGQFSQLGASSTGTTLRASNTGGAGYIARFDRGGSDATPFSILGSSGNVGIGTTNPFGGKLIVATGNVGIGSLTPGVALDVTGGIRSSQGVAGQGACWRTDGTLGQCTTSLGVGGACTCS